MFSTRATFQGRQRLTQAACLLLAALWLGSLAGCNKPPEDKLIDVATDDTAMNAAIERAQDEIDLFIGALQDPAGNQKDFAVKWKAPYEDHGETHFEHIWVDGLTYTKGQFEGALANTPVHIGGKLGDKVSFSEDDVTDWLFKEDGEMQGGYTVKVLQALK